MSLVLEVVALTHPGLMRAQNEDAVAVGDWCGPGAMTAPRAARLDLREPAVCLVADGLGGQAGGEVASALAVARLSADPAGLSAPDGIRAAVQSAHAEQLARMAADPALTGMGSTVVGVVAHGNRGRVFNVGDSRAYRWEGGYLGQVSVDDSLTKPGLSHVVTQSLGGGPHLPPPVPHVLDVELHAGDCYLLCSDGLTDYASLDDLEDCLAEDDSAVAVSRLLEAALAGGGGDNVTVLLINVRNDTRPRPAGA